MKTTAAVLYLWLLPGFLSAAEPWTLERALEEGLATVRIRGWHNTELSLPGRRWEQASATLWPRLQFQSSYRRTDNPMQIDGSILNQRSYSPRFIQAAEAAVQALSIVKKRLEGGSIRRTEALRLPQLDTPPKDQNQ